MYSQGTRGAVSSSWTYYFRVGENLRVDLPSVNSTSFFDIQINWKCVSDLPIDETWHVSCSQRKVEVNDFNKVGCVGCDCCGLNLFWDSGKCKLCASPESRRVAFIAVAVVVTVAVIGVIGLLFKYEMSLITKHLAPVAILLSFCMSTFSTVNFGHQWDSDVQETASWIDSIITFQPEGALFNPKCVDSTLSIIRIKLGLLTALPLIILAALYLTYMIKGGRNKVTAIQGVINESSLNPISSEKDTKKKSSKVSVASKSDFSSNDAQVC